MARELGTVQKFDEARGYGFIVPDAGGPNVFVHQTEILMDGYRLLVAGERVTFARGIDERGRDRALQVSRDLETD